MSHLGTCASKAALSTIDLIICSFDVSANADVDASIAAMDIIFLIVGLFLCVGLGLPPRHRLFGCNRLSSIPPFSAFVAPAGGLTGPPACSAFVLMEIETLGIARSLGWKVHMRCANGYREETRSMRRCVYRKQLDLETLVCTRGPNFPLGRLEGRLMCPACGNRRVTVVFEPPSNAQVSR
jgi:hypothetical protein